MSRNGKDENVVSASRRQRRTADVHFTKTLNKAGETPAPQDANYKQHSSEIQVAGPWLSGLIGDSHHATAHPYSEFRIPNSALAVHPTHPAPPCSGGES